MFKRMLGFLRKSDPKGDTLCVVGPDGKPTNAALHELLLEGVDDEKYRKQSYEELKASGASEEVLALFK
jgi:hypothetical protein